MLVRVCSGFSPAGRIEYGDRFVRTFDRFWPASVELQVYVEQPTAMPREAERALWDIPGARDFHDRHSGDPAIRGRDPRPCWKPREVLRRYSYRTDAYKFWKQILIPGAAAEDLRDGDIVVWLDGDVETVAPVPEGLVPELLGDADLAYLGREPKHSEIGFWAVRLGPQTRQFLDQIAAVYRTDDFLSLPQWHSAFVWDFVRQRMTPRLRERNIVAPGLRGHVWPFTALARYMVHYKGTRKKR